MVQGEGAEASRWWRKEEEWSDLEDQNGFIVRGLHRIDGKSQGV